MDYQKKAFEVEISNGGPRGYETAITLKLPATWAEFHDALQKARIPDGRNCGIELTRSWWAGLSSELIGGAQNLYELNLFAMRLTMLTSVELLSMDGLLKMEQARGTKSIPIPRLINLTFNADCHILPDVFNDESLGAFLYENEMLTKEAMCLLDTTEPGSGYHGRLLEAFGEEHRQTIGGVFTSCGYMESNGESFEEVYRPGQMAYFDRSGSPVVLEVTMGRFDDPAYDSDKSIFLNLPAVGNAIAVFECGIEYQTGRASVKDTALGAIKGFMAVGCFTLVPVELYKLAVDLQAGLTNGITGYGSIDALATGITDALSAGTVGSIDASGVFGGLTSVVTSPIMALFLIIMMGYAIVKCFFSNLKRGGILLIQIAVGSLYMFSIPRGYTDGFIQWCKQIIGLCLTTFLQATILTAGLLVLKDHALLGLGLMLSAGEVPRICGAFGLDTSTRANIMSAVYAAQTAINTTRTVIQTVAAK